MRQRPYFISLCGISLVKSCLMLLIILFAGIGLGPDEAQYWTWSQNLDWGYYSKPPGIAWEIALGTFLLGNSELGVRAIPLVFGFILPLLIYLLARSCQLSPKTAFWSALAFAFAPIGFLSSFLSITDTGMLLFWILACIIAVQGINKGAMHYAWLGIAIGAGALFKWPIYIFWPLLLASLAFSGNRRLIRIKALLLGFAISLLGLLPSIIWNQEHHWPTFQHVLATIHPQTSETTQKVSTGNFLEFLGSQLALLSPFLFLLFILAVVEVIKKIRQISFPLLFCTLASAGFLFLFLIASLFQKMQGNWVIFAYPTATILIGWYCVAAKPKFLKWEMASIAVSIVLFLGAIAIPYLQSHSSLATVLKVPYKINPFRHNVGWERLETILKKQGYDPHVHFLFGDRYQMSSILSFYGPGQKRAYFLNLNRIRKNQFSFWPGLKEEQIGKTGFFVIAENSPHLEKSGSLIPFYEKKLAEYFEKVEYLGTFPLFESYGQLVKGALLFRCIDYNGKEPPETDLY